jgi:hypothetical protein
MGYTHYWQQSKDFTPDQWSVICKDTRKIITHCGKQGIALQVEYDDTRPPAVKKSEIQFNGAGDDGHETFYVPFSPSDADKEFSFCKTAQKPYDLAVCLCLLRIAHHCPAFSFSSDGEWRTDWLMPRGAYRHLFKEAPPRLSGYSALSWLPAPFR